MTDLLWDRAFALEQTAGDEELLDELLVLFRESSAADLEQLQQAVAGNNPAGVVAAAHSIKGASASLGMQAIRQLTMAMEADGRKDSVEVARLHLDTLADLLKQI